MLKNILYGFIVVSIFGTNTFINGMRHGEECAAFKDTFEHLKTSFMTTTTLAKASSEKNLVPHFLKLYRSAFSENNACILRYLKDEADSLPAVIAFFDIKDLRLWLAITDLDYYNTKKIALLEHINNTDTFLHVLSHNPYVDDMGESLLKGLLLNISADELIAKMHPSQDDIKSIVESDIPQVIHNTAWLHALVNYAAGNKMKLTNDTCYAILLLAVIYSDVDLFKKGLGLALNTNYIIDEANLNDFLIKTVDFAHKNKTHARPLLKALFDYAERHEYDLDFTEILKVSDQFKNINALELLVHAMDLSYLTTVHLEQLKSVLQKYKQSPALDSLLQKILREQLKRK